MIYLVYTSDATRPMSERDLEQLLFQSQRNNTRYGITGLLLYTDMKFVQVIEGEKVNIMNLFENIKSDMRHTNVSVLIKGKISQRRYPEWYMGYKSMLPEEVMAKIGYRDPTQYFNDNRITDESHVYELFMKLFFDKHFNHLQPAN